MTYELDHLCVSRERSAVLDDLCLTLPSGRLIGLIGSNGAGKSTLLAALAGDLKPDGGQIALDGQALESIAPDKLAHRRAIMAQQTAAIFNLTVAQVLELGLHAFAHWSSRERELLLTEVAQATDIAQWLQQSITALSIGQQQRVHFARTLLQARAAYADHGKVWLLLDEPTASQDPWQQQMLMSICHGFSKQDCVGVLVVMHDLTLAAQWCDEIIVLKDHGVLASGNTRDVLTPQTLKRTYGSELDVEVVWAPVPAVIMAARRFT